MTGSGRRVFVAGASGAVGWRLCRLLVDDGWRVTGTTRSAKKAEALQSMGVEPVIVDAFDAGALLDAVVTAAPEVVIHQLTDLPPALDPALMPDAMIRNARLRVTGTANLVAAAKAARVRRLIAQSIAFAYAPGPHPFREDAPLNIDDHTFGTTARAVASLEQQVLSGPFDGFVLRYGRLYGPGTGFDSAGDKECPLHVDAAADAARRAIDLGQPGVYNVAEEDGVVDSSKIRYALGWSDTFRIGDSVA